MVQSQNLEEKVRTRGRGDLSSATVRTASRMAGRMAGGHASVNDIRASIQALRGFGEGQRAARASNVARTPRLRSKQCGDHILEYPVRDVIQRAAAT
jgi:hypothetical protein